MNSPPPIWFPISMLLVLELKVRLCEGQTRLQVLLMMILDADVHMPNQKQNKSEAVNKRERETESDCKNWMDYSACEGRRWVHWRRLFYESRNKVHSTSIIFQKVTNRTNKQKKKKSLGDYMLRCWFHYMATTCCQWTWRLGWFRYHPEDEKHSMNHHLG